MTVDAKQSPSRSDTPDKTPSDFFSPESIGSFVANHYGKSVFRSRISDTDLSTLAEELAGFDVRTLIARSSNDVSIWFDDRDGRFHTVDLPPAAAAKLHSAGNAAYLPGIANPVVDRWRDHLAAVLGRYPQKYLSSLFASHPGHVTAAHFDHIENFTIQLRGTKRWRISRHGAVPNCTVNYSVSTDRAHDEELWLYAKRPLPNAVPEPFEEIVLDPGSVLYVPRGYWHEVVNGDEDESLSLLIAFPVLTWIDAFLPALRTQLLRREDWRENADFSSGRSEERDTKVAGLWTDLLSLLAGTNPGQLLPPYGATETVAPSGRYRRNDLCSLGIYAVGEDSADIVAHLHLGDLAKRQEARVPARWVTAIERVVARPEADAAAIAAICPEIAEEVPAILSVLHKMCVLQPVPSTENAPMVGDAVIAALAA